MPIVFEARKFAKIDRSSHAHMRVASNPGPVEPLARSRGAIRWTQLPKHHASRIANGSMNSLLMLGRDDAKLGP